jgi:hypothetical protein
MQEEVIELIIEAFVFLSYAVAAAGVSALGLFLEYRSYLFSNSGEMVLAVWLAGLGLIMFGFAALISRNKLLVAYSGLRSE